MTKSELDALLQTLREVKTDLANVEAKTAGHEIPKRLWETLSAFANSHGGGTVLLGVDENAGFEATGVQNPKKVQQDLASMCSELEPALRPLIELHRIDSKTVIVIEVAELDRSLKPCFLKAAGMTNGAFIRVADGDRKLTSYEVQVLLAGRGQPREDEAPVSEATFEDLEIDLVNALLSRLRQPEGSHFRTLTDERSLLTLKAVRKDGPLIRPTVGGLLALGKYPQQFFPALRATFVVYPTPRVGEPGPRGERFLDERAFDGPIPKQVGAILDGLRKNMRRGSVVRGAAREDLWEYPEIALREAIVNALVHRDLSPTGRGSPVQIQMFPDRLSISNPGGLFGPVTVDRLGEDGISSARNQILMKLLEDLVAPGEAYAVCENRGSGIGAMLSSLRAAGLSPPLFDDRISTFAVTFPNHTLWDQETLRWLGAIGGGDFTDTQRVALALMRTGTELTNQTLRHRTGDDSRVATKDLQELVARGLVKQVGSRRWATYQLVDPNDLPPKRRDRRREIIDLLRLGEAMSAADIARKLGLTNQAVRFWLSRMRSERTVETTSRRLRSPTTRYRLRASTTPKPKERPRG